MGDRVQKVDADSLVIKRTDVPSMWDDFPFTGQPCKNVFGYENDFVRWVADEWTATEVGTSLQNLKDEANGVLDLTSGAVENDGTQLQLGGTGDTETTGESFLPAVGRNIWFEARVKSDDVAEHDFFVGLAIQDTSVIASVPANIIGFVTHDGDSLLDFIHNASTEVSIATLAANTYVKVGFKITGTSLCEYYVNDVKVGSVTNDIPATEMKLTIAQLTGEANAATLSIDYVACYQTVTR